MLTAIKKYILVLMMLLSSAYTFAQQDAMYTQYMFNTLAINPAYAGSRDFTSATALYRKQWVGISGAPETQTLSIDGPVKDGKVGLGLQVFNDNIGINKTTGVFGTYAYRILMDNSTLAFGIQGGVSRFSADYENVDLGSDGLIDVAFTNNVTKFMPNFGAGIYFNTDKFYAGLSLPHLLNNTLNKDNFLVTDGLVSRQYLHLFFSTGYVFSLSDDLKLKPNVLVKGVRGAPLQADLNMNLWMFNLVSFGLSYRTEADISALAEVQLNKKLRLGYAYDASTTSLVGFNAGSHEIMLRFDFGEKGSRAILNPRYF
ncbi:type IX secretion system membrane protein PorP/SprF [Pedobacter alpinus]|uniref:Type IX secretion system membrane protein PorP/SprF n=1 Tax=Pedobacter alpinus TaxID=1590643 RepID=A0ABW5TVZ6_9SPHI